MFLFLECALGRSTIRAILFLLCLENELQGYFTYVGYLFDHILITLQLFNLFFPFHTLGIYFRISRMVKIKLAQFQIATFPEFLMTS